MARKNSAESAHGFNDVIGLVLMGCSVLLLVALLSYHPRDVPANRVPTNPSIHNWIGPLGPGGATSCFFCHWRRPLTMLPAVLFLSGWAVFLSSFSYLRRRWPWAVGPFVVLHGPLDLYIAAT